MIGNDALPEILSKQKHESRKTWLKSRENGHKPITKDDKNLRISKMIDSLNAKADNFVLEVDEFSEDTGMVQLSFGF